MIPFKLGPLLLYMHGKMTWARLGNQTQVSRLPVWCAYHSTISNHKKGVQRQNPIMIVHSHVLWLAGGAQDKHNTVRNLCLKGILFAGQNFTT